MSNALEKLTLAYLELREHAQKLQSVINATQYDLAELQAKYKTVKEQKQFLQKERNKWFDAYNQIVETNEKESSAQNEQIHNLKQCIEELESQLVQLTPKEQRIDEPTDGYDDAKRVCRADFKASETPELYNTIYDNMECLHSPETTEKADEAIQPVILLANQYGDWVHGKTLNAKEQTELLFTPNKQLADQFANLDEVKDFLDDYPLDNINITYRDPKTLRPVNVVTVKTADLPEPTTDPYENLV